MYFIISIICNISSSKLVVENEQALRDVLMVVKLIFTPINTMLLLAPVGNVFGKLKDQTINTDKGGKRLIVILIVFIVAMVFEARYIGSFINTLLG